MNQERKRKLQIYREIAIIKIAIKCWMFNEIYVQKKEFKCPTKEVEMILEDILIGKLFHIQFEQSKHFNYSQAGLRILEEMQDKGILVAKYPRNVVLDCPYCYQYMFGDEWKDHKKCLEEYMDEREIE